MEKNDLIIKILIVENEKKDFDDIEPCLPDRVQRECLESLDGTDFELFPNNYVLCICDIINLKGLKEVDYKTVTAYTAFRKGIKNISKLYNKHHSNLIIITKLPLKYLREYFGLLEDDPDVNRLFVYAKLMSELNSHKSSEFSLYEHGNIRMVTKPGHEEITDKIVWQNWFKGIVNNICASRQ